MSARKLELWEPTEAGENGKTAEARQWEEERRGEGEGRGRAQKQLFKLIFPLFSFQLQIASDSSLKDTHEFFDSFFPEGRMDLLRVGWISWVDSSGGNGK